MSKRHSIRRGALSRGLSLSLAGARAGGAFALEGALRRLRGEREGDAERLQEEADRFARKLGQLKGSYVKIGQVFALLGEHFLPPALTQALHQLDSQTEPLPWSSMAPLVESALGSANAQRLALEPAAVAAASLGQVHRARHPNNGLPLAVKVQYPDVAAVIDEDFDVVVRMLRLSRWIPASREFDSWLGTMRAQLHAEIDYRREFTMAQRLRAAFDERDTASHAQNLPVPIHIPRYYPEFCGDGVLTMDWVEGHQVDSSVVKALPQALRNDLGRSMLMLFFREVFDLGLMQVDPNFGNFLIDAEGRSLSLLDFGSVLELDAALQGALADAIIAGHTGDDGLLQDALVRLGCLRTDSSDYAKETFRGFVRHLLEPLRHPDDLPRHYLGASGEYSWGRSELLSRAGRQAAGSMTSRHFNLPSGDFALIARKLTGVFTFIAVLEAEFNAWEIVAPYIDRREHSGSSLKGVRP